MILKFLKATFTLGARAQAGAGAVAVAVAGAGARAVAGARAQVGAGAIAGARAQAGTRAQSLSPNCPNMDQLRNIAHAQLHIVHIKLHTKDPMVQQL